MLVQSKEHELNKEANTAHAHMIVNIVYMLMRMLLLWFQPSMLWYIVT